MANIDSYLAQIRSAVFGEEVRGSIINALEAQNNETESTTATVEQTVVDVNIAIGNAEEATNAANTAAANADASGENAVQIAQEAADSAQKTADDAADEAVRIATEAAENATQTASEAAESAKETASSAAEEAVEIAQNAADTATQTADNAAAEAVQIATEAAESAKQTASDAADEAKHTAEDAADEAVRIAQEAADSATATASSAADEAVQIAQDAADEAVETANEAAQEAVDTANDAVAGVEDAIEAAREATQAANDAVEMQIASYDISYQTSSIGTVAPTGEWVHSIPTVADGNYLWTKIEFTLNNGSVITAYSVAKNGGTAGEGGEGNLWYGICETDGDTQAKTVPCDGFMLDTGSEIVVNFVYTNTSSNATLEVNSTGAYPIYYKGAPVESGLIKADTTYMFVFSGTEYDVVGILETEIEEISTATIDSWFE